MIKFNCMSYNVAKIKPANLQNLILLNLMLTDFLKKNALITKTIF